MSLRRTFVLGAVILCLVSGLPAHPYGQRRPTLSGDLTHVQGDRIRLIVQPAIEGDVSSLRGRLRGIVQRELEGAVALEVSRADFEAMSQDASFAHISADAPVVADMAITNKVTGASAMWQGTGGSARPALDRRVQRNGHWCCGGGLGIAPTPARFPVIAAYFRSGNAIDRDPYARQPLGSHVEKRRHTYRVSGEARSFIIHVGRG